MDGMDGNADVFFHVEGAIIPAHKLVLVHSSEVFKVMESNSLSSMFVDCIVGVHTCRPCSMQIQEKHPAVS